MRRLESLKTLKITCIPLFCWYSFTVRTAISAALWLGKRNCPVEMQQKAMLLTPFCSASSRQARKAELS